MSLRRRILCADDTFDYALRGPFDNLCFTRLSAARALCRSIITVISASTVWSYQYALIKALLFGFVNTHFCAPSPIFNSPPSALSPSSASNVSITAGFLPAAFLLLQPSHLYFPNSSTVILFLTFTIMHPHSSVRYTLLFALSSVSNVSLWGCPYRLIMTKELIQFNLEPF